MPEQVLERILREGLAMRGLSADENTLRRFRIYYDNLEACNRVMNLTEAIVIGNHAFYH